MIVTKFNELLGADFKTGMNNHPCLSLMLAMKEKITDSLDFDKQLFHPPSYPFRPAVPVEWDGDNEKVE